jgi:ankyrin repeat protein
MSADAYTIKALLEHGADENAKCPFNRSPLFYTNDVEVASILLFHGANVNAVDEFGHSPLYYEQDSGKPDDPVIHFLKQHGAHLTKTDRIALAADWKPAR